MFMRCLVCILRRRKGWSTYKLWPLTSQCPIKDINYQVLFSLPLPALKSNSLHGSTVSMHTIFPFSLPPRSCPSLMVSLSRVILLRRPRWVDEEPSRSIIQRLLENIEFHRLGIRLMDENIYGRTLEMGALIFFQECTIIVEHLLLEIIFLGECKIARSSVSVGELMRDQMNWMQSA